MRYRRRGRGIIGLPFMLFFIIMVFTHSFSGFLIALVVLAILSLIFRAAMPGIFGSRNMNNAAPPFQQPQQPYYQPPQPIYQPPQQAYQPYEQEYQPYQQGYQAAPPPVYQAPEQPYQYQPPQQENYEEQPQAEYPQEMPPMQQ